MRLPVAWKSPLAVTGIETVCAGMTPASVSTAVAAGSARTSKLTGPTASIRGVTVIAADGSTRYPAAATAPATTTSTTRAPMMRPARRRRRGAGVAAGWRPDATAAAPIRASSGTSDGREPPVAPVAGTRVAGVRSEAGREAPDERAAASVASVASAVSVGVAPCPRRRLRPGTPPGPTPRPRRLRRPAGRPGRRPRRRARPRTRPRTRTRAGPPRRRARGPRRRAPRCRAAGRGSSPRERAA